MHYPHKRSGVPATTLERFTKVEVTKHELAEIVFSKLLQSKFATTIQVPNPAAAVLENRDGAASVGTGNRRRMQRTPSQLAEERVIRGGGSRLPSLMDGLQSKRRLLERAECAEQQIFGVSRFLRHVALLSELQRIRAPPLIPSHTSRPVSSLVCFSRKCRWTAGSAGRSPGAGAESRS